MTCMRQDEGSRERRFIEGMKAQRLARGWSQERLVDEVAKKTGLSLNATVVTKLEWALDPDRAHKARGLGLDEASAIADALGISIDKLAGSGEPGEVRNLRLRWTELGARLIAAHHEKESATREALVADGRIMRLARELLETESLLERLGVKPEPITDGGQTYSVEGPSHLEQFEFGDNRGYRFVSPSGVEPPNPRPVTDRAGNPAS